MTAVADTGTMTDKPDPDAAVLAARCRVAVARLQLAAADIAEAAAFLRAGRISTRGALQSLHDSGVLDLVLGAEESP